MKNPQNIPEEAQRDGADKANGVKWRSKLKLDPTVANSIQAAWVGGPPNPGGLSQ